MVALLRIRIAFTDLTFLYVCPTPCQTQTVFRKPEPSLASLRGFCSASASISCITIGTCHRIKPAAIAKNATSCCVSAIAGYSTTA